MTPLEVTVGDVFRMRRQHPCGGWDWMVYRAGADIGLECLTCRHRVLLDRRRFESRVRSRISQAPPP